MPTAQQRQHQQLDMFEHVAQAYAQPEDGRLTNEELYRIAAGRAGISKADLNATQPIGKAGVQRSVLKRKVRWHQQRLAQLGLIQHVAGERAVWELTEGGRQKLRKARSEVAVLGFSTELGIAIWGEASRVFDRWDEPICLALTSLPYMLRTPRAYGNPTDTNEYIDFACRIFEPIVRNLVKGGSIALNLSQDIFLPGSPARSLYLEKLTIAMCERLGLFLLDRIVWESNKPPAPIQYASKQRMQLNSGYELILYFSNDPHKAIPNNLRILNPHTEAHKKLMANGGEKRHAVNGDGAYRLSPGSFGRVTEGSIQRNVIKISNHCASQREYKRVAKSLGLAAHGAPMPLALARKIVRFMSDVGSLVVDPCAGSNSTGLAAELEGRRWAATDNVFDYIRGAAERFRDRPGFDLALNAV